MGLGMKNYNILGVPEESDFEGGVFMYFALCFVQFEHSVCHEPIFVLIN